MRYKIENGLSWRQLVELTGVPYTSLCIATKREPKDLKGMSFATHLRIKSTIGVDLYDWFESNVRVQFLTK